jgi:hypothetical protein
VSKLALRQTVLLKTLKGRELDAGEASESARLRRAAACTAMLRETMLWWRQLGLAQACPLTVAVLQRFGRWPEVLNGFVRDTPGSAQLGIQAGQFLDYVASAGDALIAATATTERALRRSAGDPNYRAELTWPCDPSPVLGHCLAGTPLETAGPRAERYRVTIGRTGACSIEWRADAAPASGEI